MKHFITIAVLALGCSDEVSDHAEAAPPVAFSLHYGPYPVAPGVEGVVCLDAPGPDHDVWYKGWRASSTLMHHAIVWQRTSGTPYAEPTRCASPATTGVGLFSILQPEETAYLSENPKYAGVAMKFPAATDIIWDVHYLNPSAEWASVEVVVDFFDAPDHTLVAEGFYLDGGGGLAVPPQTTQTIEYSCPVPSSPMTVLLVTSHVHAHNVWASFAVNGVEMYRSTDWSEPLIKGFNSEGAPSLIIEPTDKVTWTCQIKNDSASVLRYSNQVFKGEMCTISGVSIGPKWGCKAPTGLGF